MSRLERLVTPRKISIITEASKAGISGLTFLLMALLLGPSEYGVYVQFAAIAVILVPLVSGGYAFWVQPLAKSNGVSDAASAAISILITIGLPFTVLCVFLTDLVFPHNFSKILVVFFVEMLLYPIWSSITLVFLSNGSLIKYLITSVSVPLIKLLGTIVALNALSGGLLIWGAVLAPLGVIGLAITSALAKARGPFHGFRVARAWLRRGAGFASVGTASAATDNVDKLMVGFLGGVSAAGNYGVAARFAAYAVIPVRALALVAYPRYFQLAEERDLLALRALMHRTIRRGLWLGCVSAGLAATALVIASATILKQYEGSVLIGCILALLIPLRAVQYAAGDVSYAIGKSHWRLFMTIVGALATAGSVSFGFLIAESLGAALGAVLAGLLVSGMLLGYVEFWISKNAETKKRGRHVLLRNNR